MPGRRPMSGDEKRLRKEARRAGLRTGTPRFRAYVYGTLRTIRDRRAAKRHR